MKINEIFDTNLKITPENWQSKGRFLMVNFIINKQGYTIQLEKKPIEGINNAAEVSFFRNDIDDLETAFSTTDEQLSPLKVYGIVGNAVLAIADQYDAMLINAERRHSENEKEYTAKIHIYNSLTQKLTRRLGFKLYTIPEEYKRNKQHTTWLISKISPNETSQYKDEQNLALEHCLKYGKVFVLNE